MGDGQKLRDESLFLIITENYENSSLVTRLLIVKAASTLPKFRLFFFLHCALIHDFSDDLFLWARFASERLEASTADKISIAFLSPNDFCIYSEPRRP